jgi:hypothetical protein
LLTHQSTARSLIKLDLELGGKDAYVVLNDADLAHTVPMLISGKFENTGQVPCRAESEKHPRNPTEFTRVCDVSLQCVLRRIGI